jgi:type 1 glutamine amidotransferase
MRAVFGASWQLWGVACAVGWLISPVATSAQDAQSPAAQVPSTQDSTDPTPSPQTTAAAKKVVFVAGPPSHAAGEHEHNAGCILLAERLAAAMPNFTTQVTRNGWPDDDAIFEGADAIVIFCDGGNGHVVMNRLEEVDAMMARGVGLVCLHYAVEIPKGEPGEKLLNWIGGYFETDWSVNPHWDAEFKEFPTHPITSGVEPFTMRDEWYFHMRFSVNMEHVTPILSAVAPESTMTRPDGPHEGNPAVRAAVAAGEPQHMAWAYERPGGGRGVGFTGGHFHNNWGDDNFRRLVLNAIVWTAQGEVPAAGVVDGPVTLEQLAANQDEQGRGRRGGRRGGRGRGRSGQDSAQPVPNNQQPIPGAP